MILDATTKKIQIVLTAAKTTTDMPVVVDYVDMTTTTTLSGILDTATNGTTVTDIVAAPSASTQRKINMISVYNADTASKVVQAIYNNNGTSRTLVSATLSVGDTLGYTDAAGWYTQDANGNRKTMATSSAQSIASAIVLATNKAIPVDADELALNDSVSGTFMALLWSDLKATLKTYFDSLTTTLTNKTITNPTIDQINSGQIGGWHDGFINGAYQVNQLNNPANAATGTAVTITAGAAINFAIDQWYTQCTTTNITAQQVAGTAPFKYAYKLIAGATGPTATLHGTRIEGKDCVINASQTMAVQVRIICDAARTVTWTAYYANTEDTFAAKTQIATGSISATTSLVNYTYTFNAGANAGNGLCIEYTTGTLTNSTGYIQYSGHQIERVSSGATVGTSYEYACYADQLRWCRRFLPVFNSVGTTSFLGMARGTSATTANMASVFPVPTRVPVTASVINSAAYVTISPISVASAAGMSGVTSLDGAVITFTVTGSIAGYAADCYFNNATGQLYFIGAQL